jgi:NAD dependent epimerase/dehydratase family enzyme
MKVVIAGGSGYIGRSLSTALVTDRGEVVVLSRRPERERMPAGARMVGWDARTPAGAWTRELAGADAVVNLCGASIGSRRWTAARKAELLASRLLPTDALVGAIGALPSDARPEVLVNASGIDYYGDRPAALSRTTPSSWPSPRERKNASGSPLPPGEGQREGVTRGGGDGATRGRGEGAVLDEGAPPGDSFLAGLCVKWEAAARAAEPLGVRVVRMRTALVVGRDAPALKLMALPFRLFVGGPLGGGEQPFTWIHLDDLVGLYRLAMEHTELVGPVNAVAPDVRPQRNAAADVGAVLHRPSFFPSPAPLLRLALGERADLLLHGRHAIPDRALTSGFRFRYPELRPALADALGGTDPSLRSG